MFPQRTEKLRRRNLTVSLLALSVFLGAILFTSGHTHSSKEYSEKGIFSKHLAQISGNCFACDYTHLSSDRNPEPITHSSPELFEERSNAFYFYNIENPKSKASSERGPPTLS
ncbi:hypothetical protein EHO59_09255 [Leptospira semungkisensis]|uniref:Uncharacterized protein n=1 Tax=Leptospira semungkisensis TaxID=2484985 RepID=A0A4V3JC77_9LEPT|nr:hypothetical protein [Leptospira semungkisensis]TGK05019.1 hypothetical protein EHO59_09255 [Leptospira semungkisensis]